MSSIGSQTSEKPAHSRCAVLCYARRGNGMLCQGPKELPIFSVVRIGYKWTRGAGKMILKSELQSPKCFECKSLEPNLKRLQHGNVCALSGSMCAFVGSSVLCIIIVEKRKNHLALKYSHKRQGRLGTLRPNSFPSQVLWWAT